MREFDLPPDDRYEPEFDWLAEYTRDEERDDRLRDYTPAGEWGHVAAGGPYRASELTDGELAA